GVGIGALARATTQYNDIHRNLPSSCRRRAARFSVLTKTDGVIQMPADCISCSRSQKKAQAETSKALIGIDMNHDMKP
ncbi:MAG: hypothetical protein SO111_00605, partial [Collinsella sp.]|nr:hypothetical protein [Collinsella sp.]